MYSTVLNVEQLREQDGDIKECTSEVINTLREFKLINYPLVLRGSVQTVNGETKCVFE